MDSALSQPLVSFMSQDFYELLRISKTASTDEIQEAFRQRTAHLVRRLRVAKQRGASITRLEIEESNLRQAMEILSDPNRRRSYDVFRSLSEHGIPDDIKQLWDFVKPAILDPKISAAIHVLKHFTSLPIDNLSLLQPKLIALPEEATTSPRINPIPSLSTPKRQKKTVKSTKISQSKQAKSKIKTSTKTRSKQRTAKKQSPPQNNRSYRGPLTASQLDSLAARIGYDGRFIRTVRENRGLSLDDLATATRISINFLRAIENNSFDQLPSTTFVKGYINTIARTLGIDDRPIVNEYMRRFRSNR